jgi:hypothetical protein
LFPHLSPESREVAKQTFHCWRMGNPGTQQARFENFTERLLLKKLDDIPWEAHIQVMHQADFATAIALSTPYPFLIFPCLFDERVSSVLEIFHAREAVYWSAEKTVQLQA